MWPSRDLIYSRCAILWTASHSEAQKYYGESNRLGVQLNAGSNLNCRNFTLFPQYSAALTFLMELFYICKIKTRDYHNVLSTGRIPLLSFTDYGYFLCWTPSLLHLFCLICLLLIIFFCWYFISICLLRKHFIIQTLNQITAAGNVWNEAAQFSQIVLCQWVTGRSL